MIDDKDLCQAMREAVAARRKSIQTSEEEEPQNEAVYELFKSTSPRFERPVDGAGTVLDRKVDIRLRSRWRMKRVLNRKAGTAWREWRLQTLIDWLLENWETVLRVLFSLIMIIV